MADVPPQGPAAPSVQALLDALDARSRAQAEDAAGRLLGNALDRVGEALASVEQRLSALEQRTDNAAVFTQVVELGARLERFEQAFYRAVSDGGDGSDVVQKIEAVVRQGTADYVRALEGVRERQVAELSGLQTTIGEVVRSEVQAAAVSSEAAPVDLTPLIVRLDEVSAKIQRPTTDAMRELAERLEAQVDRLHESFPRLNELRQSWSEEFRPVAERLQSLEEVVGRTANVPADLPDVAGRLEGAVERLSGLEHQLRERDASLAQLDGRMEGLESRTRAHLAGLTERVEGVMGAVTQAGTRDDERRQLGEIAAAVSRLGELVAAVDERVRTSEHAIRSQFAELAHREPDDGDLMEQVTSVLSALPEAFAAPDGPSTEEIASAVRAALADELASLRQPQQSDPGIEELRRDIQSLAAKEPPALEMPQIDVPSADEIAALVEQRVTEQVTERVVERVGERVTQAVDALRDAIPAPAPVAEVPSSDDTAAKVRDMLHREFELLTQRVAAMQSSLEATRNLLDQHVEDTAQSLGRRATEAGRKLAADLGFRPRKGERRDPRELNRGGH